VTLRVGVLTVSDRSARGERPDTSGPALEAALQAQGAQIVRRETIADERSQIRATLLAWADAGDCDVILTTGGTGFGQRDVTPEATLEVVNRRAPGITEAMRARSLAITPHAMLSRAVAGIRGTTLIVNLPGSPKGALENLEVLLPVLPHAAQLLRDDPQAEQGHSAAGGADG
jgi:molybdenum cofactor synthesis domain-containing protein